MYALRARLGGPPEADRGQPGKRGPKTALSDEELVEEGGFDKAIALGLGLRHDWGSQYRARQFQTEIKWLGIRSTPAYVGKPECNGVAERFIRTLKQECIDLHDFETPRGGQSR